MSFKARNEVLNLARAAAGTKAVEQSDLQVCGHCGQKFDARIMGQVHHHLQPQHKWL